MKFLMTILAFMAIIFTAMGGLAVAPAAHIKGDPHNAACGRGPPPPPSPPPPTSTY
ncbi:hypothetical protein KGM_212756 [Danaus plexippus plexippus]|uniref:Uncharacterized protein n=1 Tax=Danaus plexippus plexippus TaxID=278856 RepID=A0A212F269_DANPL|nr:hypothetical protein KGM_212756 [Danaus plexippus plexippus]